jgi:hypothetical protein
VGDDDLVRRARGRALDVERRRRTAGELIRREEDVLSSDFE